MKTKSLKEHSPSLAKQFDETKNGVKASEIAYSNNQRHWWKCEKGHSWQGKLYNRTLSKRVSCPVCDESLIIPGVNDFLTTIDKESKVYKQVDFSKTTESFLKTLHPRSKTTLPWRCFSGHEWEEPLRNRLRGTGCPYCSGKRVAYENSVASSPLLLQQYFPLNQKPPTEVPLVSRKKVKWVCEKEHEYDASPFNRSLGQQCPYCSFTKTLKGFNDLRSTDEELAKEYSPKNKLSSEEVRRNESRPVIWRCSACNGEWKRALRLRAIRQQGCPYCYKRQQSRLEEEVFQAIKLLTDEEITRNDRELLAGKELDFFIPKLNVAIEFNGNYWHSDEFLRRRGTTAKKYHEAKKKLAEEKSILLGFVWEADWVNSEAAVTAALKALIEKRELNLLLRKYSLEL